MSLKKLRIFNVKIAGQVYWAKDIVFLVAEGHLGTLAWAKGHQQLIDSDDNVKFENVHAKAGNIQVML